MTQGDLYCTHRTGKSGHEVLACPAVAMGELSGPLLPALLGCPGFLPPPTPVPPPSRPRPRLEQDLELEVQEASFVTALRCNETDICPKHSQNGSQ